MKKYWGAALAGLGAGAVTGLFGAGGGMVLVPLLHLLTDTEEERLFPTSLSIIAPICIVCLILRTQVPLADALPYLPGSLLGGLAAGRLRYKIPAVWLHRILGAFILWGGIRYLC